MTEETQGDAIPHSLQYTLDLLKWSQDQVAAPIKAGKGDVVLATSAESFGIEVIEHAKADMINTIEDLKKKSAQLSADEEKEEGSLSRNANRDPESKVWKDREDKLAAIRSEQKKTQYDLEMINRSAAHLKDYEEAYHKYNSNDYSYTPEESALIPYVVKNLSSLDTQLGKLRRIQESNQLSDKPVKPVPMPPGGDAADEVHLTPHPVLPSDPSRPAVEITGVITLKEGLNGELTEPEAHAREGITEKQAEEIRRQAVEALKNPDNVNNPDWKPLPDPNEQKLTPGANASNPLDGLKLAAAGGIDFGSLLKSLHTSNTSQVGHDACHNKYGDSISDIPRHTVLKLGLPEDEIGGLRPPAPPAAELIKGKEPKAR